MKLQSLLNEEIKPTDKKSIIIFDIDDTLLSANPSVIKIYKSFNGGPETPLSTDEFAKDPDKGKEGYKFDIREFRDPKKVYDSIIKGTPIIRNLRIMDSYINAGYKMAFLTARGLEEVVAEALGKYLLHRNGDKQFIKIPSGVFRREMSFAVNDEKYIQNGKNVLGDTDGAKKGTILKRICSKYDRVVFVDDDLRNITFAKSLQLPNLKVVTANPKLNDIPNTYLQK